MNKYNSRRIILRFSYPFTSHISLSDYDNRNLQDINIGFNKTETGINQTILLKFSLVSLVKEITATLQSIYQFDIHNLITLTLLNPLQVGEHRRQSADQGLRCLSDGRNEFASPR